jgi:hypothetical protein
LYIHTDIDIMALEESIPPLAQLTGLERLIIDVGCFSHDVPQRIPVALSSLTNLITLEITYCGYYRRPRVSQPLAPIFASMTRLQDLSLVWADGTGDRGANFQVRWKMP